MTNSGGAAPLKTGRFARHATWLELFYDLIYVVVIAKLAGFITHPIDDQITVPQYGVFAALFVPVWWAWTGHTMFQNRFDPDDTPHKILTLLQMLAAGFMAVFIADAVGDGAREFAATYVAIRVLLIAMYWRVHRREGDHRDITRIFVVGFSCGALLWLASIFAGAWMFWFWGAGLLVDMVTPWLGRKRLTRVSVHASHLPERLGLLTIIVLGESVVSIIDGIEGSGIATVTVIAMLFGFLLLGAVWWHYFHTLESALMDGEYSNGQLAIYGHLPVYMGLVTIAAGVRFGITGDLSSPQTAALLCGGMVLFLLPLQVIHGSRMRGRRVGQFVIANLILLAGLAAVVGLSFVLPQIWVLALVALVYTAYVVHERPEVRN